MGKGVELKDYTEEQTKRREKQEENKIKEKVRDRTVIAKPIACRPTCSTFKSFPELPAGAINASPSIASSEAAVTAIRPKTVRVKPAVNCAPVEVLSSQAEVPGAAFRCSSNKYLKVDSVSTVLYKPLAKLVSKTTVSLLANLENSYVNHQPALAQVEPSIQPPNQVRHHLRSDISSNRNGNNPLTSETEKVTGTPKMAEDNLKENRKPLPSTSTVNRPSYDGYSWRKYGQKRVRGSEYPRSYYKCTHPKCPVKKKVERSLDWQIAETVYKGKHNHSKPQPPKRNTSGGQGQGFISDATGQDLVHPLSNNKLNERNEGSEGRSDNQNEVEVPPHSIRSGKRPLYYDPMPIGELKGSVASPDNSHDLTGDCEEDSMGVEVENDEPKSKRRRKKKQSKGTVTSEEDLQEPCFVVQSSTDSELIGDGFHWRKYGQKVVKGNPYPRSYYRCTGIKCNVRKHVERASDDPRAFITTYEGKHNHDMPIKNKNPAASAPDSKATVLSDGQPMIKTLE